MALRKLRRYFNSGQVVAGSVALAIILLLMTLTLAASMLAQTRDLDRNVEVTSGIINANVRTLGQLQRELLRMSVKLQDPATTAQDLELQRSFVTQRVAEAQLSYQLQTLGTEELLADARRLGSDWNNKVAPRIESIIAERSSGSDFSTADTTEVLEQIRVIEIDVNHLVAKGEINRKNQAGHANDVTVQALHDARRLAAGLVITFIGVMVLLIIAATSYRRFERQRRTSQAQLVAVHAEAQTLSEVASRTSNMVIITDATGKIEWLNEAFVSTTGYSMAEARGKTPGALLQGVDTSPVTVRYMKRRILRGDGFTTEVLNYTREGAPYWASIEVRPVHDSSGVLTNFIAVQSDVTASREAAAVLRSAKDAAIDLAEEKAQFLAIMSHEIRTPLNAVIGLTDLLLDSDLGPQQREYVQIAHNSGSLVLSTISNILSYSASDSGNVELEAHPFAPHTIALRTIGLLETQTRDKGLRLKLTVDEDVPDFVLGDQVRLQQVLVNLVGNAVKFTERGRVDLVLRAAEAPRVDPSLCAVRFEVADTGIGIATDRVDRLFQPFAQADASTTRRYGGSGLGLAISRQLVELMGGEITVDSTPGQGSRFSFTLLFPRADAPAKDDSRPKFAPAEADDAGLRILLVEDDQINQTVAQHMLARLGHEVTVANDGVEGVAAAQADDFDVIFMDIQMPRMDGLTATREIRKLLPPDRQPVIVALTANALDGDRERFLEADMDLYLSKPFRGEQLAETLRQADATANARQERAAVGAL